MLHILIIIGLLSDCFYSITYFSTKSSYSLVENQDVSPFFPPSYYPIYARYVGRHGSRYPGNGDMEIISKVYKHLEMHSSIFTSLINTSSVSTDRRSARSLAPSGIKELRELGERYRKRLVGMLSDTKFDPSTIKFESTCRIRAIHSMMSFLSGFLPFTNQTVKLPLLETKPCNEDISYRFFDFCPYYTNFHKCHKIYQVEQQKLFRHPYMAHISEHVNTKLLLQKQHHLHPHDILALYLACAYNISINYSQKDQGACSLFGEKDLDFFDYLLDIKNFHKKGPSIKINSEVACPLFNTIYDSIINALNSCQSACPIDQKGECTVPLNGEFGFAHAETIIPLMSIFGIFGHDKFNIFVSNTSQHLTTETYAQNNHNKRNFFGGKYSPMAGHILFTVGCSHDGIKEPSVMVIINEKPVELTCCKGNVLDFNSKYPVCSSKQFIECFGQLVHSCDFFNTCYQEYGCKVN